MLSLTGIHVKVNNYGEGYGEVTWSFKGTYKEKEHTTRGKSEKREENIIRSVRRSKSTLRKKIMTAGFTHMLTLDFQDDVEDLELAKDCFTRFIRLVKKYKKNYDYASVWEIQPKRYERTGKAVWHFHLAVKGFQEVNLLRHLWKTALKERGLNGNIDVKYFKKGGKWKRAKISNYISKYVGKDIQESDLNKKRYFISKGIEIPEENIIIPFQKNVFDSVFKIFSKRVGQPIRHVFIPPEEESSPLMGWGCSWEYS